MNVCVGAKQWVLLQAQHQREEIFLTSEGTESEKVEQYILDRYIEIILSWRFLDNYSLVCLEMW